MSSVRSSSGGSYKTRKIGASTIVSRNRIPAVLNAMLFAGDIAARAGAKQAVREAKDIHSSGGDGEWAPNTPATIEWKKHNRVYVGRTQTLVHNLKVEPLMTGVWAAGWLGDEHPDTKGRLSDGELANILEHGAVMQNAMAQRATLPPRPWLSKVADNPQREESVINEMALAYLAALDRKKIPVESGSDDQSTLGEFDFSGVV